MPLPGEDDAPKAPRTEEQTLNDATIYTCKKISVLIYNEMRQSPRVVVCLPLTPFLVIVLTRNGTRSASSSATAPVGKYDKGVPDRAKMGALNCAPPPRAIRLYIDIQGAARIISQMTTRSPRIMTELRIQRQCLGRHNLHLSPIWLPSAANLNADRLSRTFDPTDVKVLRGTAYAGGIKVFQL